MGARDLLADLAAAGMSICAEGDRLVIRPASKLTDDLRAALRAAKPELMALLSGGGCAAAAHPPASPIRRFRLSPVDADRCHAGGWSDAEIAAFVGRHARLLSIGFTDADDLAERLVLRDRDGDERRLCVECRHYRGRAGGTCRQPNRADLGGPAVGALALVLHCCPAFGPIGGASC